MLPETEQPEPSSETFVGDGAEIMPRLSRALQCVGGPFAVSECPVRVGDVEPVQTTVARHSLHLGEDWSQPDAKHASLYEAEDVPEPPTLRDDYADRGAAAAAARMRVGRDMRERDWKVPLPANMTEEADLAWKYQRYIKDYLRCVASVDDNVGRLLDYLDSSGLAGDTAVVYTSDQGFFLGDHGWYDKRFMYEESLRMPLLVRHPAIVPTGSVANAMVLNLDFAQTFLDLAGVPALPTMQGRSFVPVLRGDCPADWRRSIYYRYWMHDDHPHHVRAHYGVRTERYKLIFYYGQGLGVTGASDHSTDPEWELFDLERDPMELHSVHDDPAYATIRQELESELDRVQREAGDQPWERVS